MVTKGHDFPGVTLVGVVLADQGSDLPDFRASERTFQLLEQVAGRAGRGDKPGRVLVQTFKPRADAITCARDHDYARFVEAELRARVDTRYPPADAHGLRARRRRRSAEVRETADARRRGGAALASARRPSSPPRSLGPAEAPLSRLKGRTRWQLFLKARNRAPCAPWPARRRKWGPHGGFG